MNNQTLETNFASNSCLETNLKINELLIAYPDNYLNNPGRIFITKCFLIRPNIRNSLDIKLEWNSYKVLKYDKINSELKNFVDERVKKISKSMGGAGGPLCIGRCPGQSIKIFEEYSAYNILELTLLRSKELKDIKFARFALWGDDLRFLRSELKENCFQYKSGDKTE